MEQGGIDNVENQVITNVDRDAINASATDILFYMCYRLAKEENLVAPIPQAMYYFRKAVDAAPPTQGKSNLLRFLADVFVSQAVDFVPYYVPGEGINEYRNRIEQDFPYFRSPNPTPGMDIREYEDRVIPVLAEKEMLRANGKPGMPEYYFQDGTPLYWWSLNPVEYFKPGIVVDDVNGTQRPESQYEFRNRIRLGNVLIDDALWSALDPNLTPWRNKDSCAEIKNRLRQMYITREKNVPVDPSKTSSLSPPKRFQTPISMTNTRVSLTPIPLQKAVKEVERSVGINLSPEAKVRLATGTSGSTFQPPSILSSRGQPLEEAETCDVCLSPCIPQDVLQIFLQHKDRYMNASGVKLVDEDALTAYKNQARIDAAQGGRLYSAIFSALGDKYPTSLLLSFLTRWVDAPEIEEYYNLKNETGVCNTLICRECIQALQEEFRTEKIGQHASTRGIKYPFAGTGPKQTKIKRPGERRSPPRSFKQLIGVTEVAKRIYRYQVPQAPTQPPSEYLPVEEFQVPWTWFDARLGPYALVPGSLVYFRPTEADPINVTTLSLGTVNEYDTEHFDITTSDKDFVVGYYPTRLVITPIFPYGGYGAVESIPIDMVFPVNYEIPSQAKVLKIRGQIQQSEEEMHSLFPPELPLSEQIASLEKYLTTESPGEEVGTKLGIYARLLKERQAYLANLDLAVQSFPNLTPILAQAQVDYPSVFSGSQSQNLVQGLVSVLQVIDPRFEDPRFADLILRQLGSSIPPYRQPLAPLTDDRKLDIIYSVVASKYRDFRQQKGETNIAKEADITPEARATVILAVLLGWVINQRMGDEVVNLYAATKNLWNEIFSGTGPEGNPDYFNFPGPNGAPLSQSPPQFRSIAEANKAMKQGGYDRDLKYIYDLLTKYTWNNVYESLIPKPKRGGTEEEEFDLATFRTPIRGYVTSIGAPPPYIYGFQPTQQPLPFTYPPEVVMGEVEPGEEVEPGRGTKRARATGGAGRGRSRAPQRRGGERESPPKRRRTFVPPSKEEVEEPQVRGRALDPFLESWISSLFQEFPGEASLDKVRDIIAKIYPNLIVQYPSLRGKFRRNLSNEEWDTIVANFLQGLE